MEELQIDVIGKERLEDMRSGEKISTILTNVENGKIVVLEVGLDPDEESRLVEETMSRIQPDTFAGIEIESYPSNTDTNTGLLNRFFGDNTDTNNLTIIGPADRIQEVTKETSLISTLVK